MIPRRPVKQAVVYQDHYRPLAAHLVVQLRLIVHREVTAPHSGRRTREMPLDEGDRLGDNRSRLVGVQDEVEGVNTVWVVLYLDRCPSLSRLLGESIDAPVEFREIFSGAGDEHRRDRLRRGPELGQRGVPRLFRRHIEQGVKRDTLHHFPDSRP